MGKRNPDGGRKLADYAVFGILLVLYSVMTYLLFYRQAIEYRGIYYSDMKAYILESRGLESGYDFPYPLFFWLSRLWMLFVTPERAEGNTFVLGGFCAGAGGAGGGLCVRAPGSEPG